MNIRFCNTGFRVSEGSRRSSVADAAEKIYVSTFGSDINDGSEQSPLLTIGKAIEVAEGLSSYRVAIILEEGTYRVNSTITINSEKKLIFWGNGKVNMKGSTVIPFEATDDSVVIKSDTPVACQPYQLFVNGNRRLTSSTPRPQLIERYSGCSIPSGLNTFNDTDGKKSQRFGMNPADIQNLLLNDSYKNGWATIMHNWASCKVKIKAVDPIANTITFRTFQNPTGQGNLFASAGDFIVFENFRFSFVANSYRESFVEGSYYRDADGYLYYHLKPGETLLNSEIAIPALEELFHIQTPTEFYNICFSETYYEFFDTAFACSDTQSAYSIPSCIEVYGHHVTFSRCEFTGIAQNCIGFRNGSYSCRVDSCYFHHSGCSSVRIGELDESASNVPKFITVNNCVVEYIGQLLQQSSGVIICFADSCFITHCDVSKTFYTGITSGHIWGKNTANTYFKSCYIGYNHIHHIACDIMSDLGGIYNLGATQGMIIEYNFIHDIIAGGANGLYPDEGTKQCIMRNNIVMNVTRGFLYHFCNNNLIENNIFYNCLLEMFEFYGSFDDTLTRNIFYQKNGGICTLREVERQIITTNIYWKESSSLPAISFDSNPVIADPIFVSPVSHDFSFKNNAAISQIGFIPIDQRRIGVLGKSMQTIAAINHEFNERYKLKF